MLNFHLDVYAFLGTWKYNDSYAMSGVIMAAKAGFVHIDTANDYWNQAGTGDGINEVIKTAGRSSLFVTSKVEGCGVEKPPHGTPVRKGHCYNDTLLRFEENLSLLKLDTVDLMLIHWPPKEGCNQDTCPWMQQQWAAFEEMYKAGKTRAIGVSNYCISCLKCLEQTMKITPAINQVEFVLSRSSLRFSSPAATIICEPACSPPPFVTQIQYHVGMGNDPDGLLSYCAQKKIQVCVVASTACCINCVLHQLRAASTACCIDCVLHQLRAASTACCINCVLHQLRAASTACCINCMLPVSLIVTSFCPT
jgi:diketogulonate reductase-like aldo/keto reductase